MSELDKTIERLRNEGHSSEEIQGALAKIREDALKQPRFTGSLDDYLDSLDEKK